LLHKVLVGFSNAVWVEASVAVCFPLWIILHGPAPVSQDATIDDGMCNVDVLWPKLFVQALAQASHSKFCDRKNASDSIASQTGGGTGEDKCSPLARAFTRMFYWVGQLVSFESCDRGPRERKGSDYSGGGGTLDVFISHLKELLECAFPSIIDGHANLRGGKVGIDR